MAEILAAIVASISTSRRYESLDRCNHTPIVIRLHLCATVHLYASEDTSACLSMAKIEAEQRRMPGPLKHEETSLKFAHVCGLFSTQASCNMSVRPLLFTGCGFAETSGWHSLSEWKALFTANARVIRRRTCILDESTTGTADASRVNLNR